MESAKHVFFTPGDISFNCIRRNPKGIVANQIIGEFFPFFYTNTAMTYGPVRIAKSPAHIGVVEVDTVFIPEIEFNDSE